MVEAYTIAVSGVDNTERIHALSVEPSYRLYSAHLSHNVAVFVRASYLPRPPPRPTEQHGRWIAACLGLRNAEPLLNAPLIPEPKTAIRKGATRLMIMVMVKGKVKVKVKVVSTAKASILKTAVQTAHAHMAGRLKRARLKMAAAAATPTTATAMVARTRNSKIFAVQ